MKIGLVSKEFVPSRGGAERYASNLALHLAKLGHEVHVFAPNFEKTEYNGIHLHQVPMSKNQNSWRKRLQKALPSTLELIYSLTQFYPTDVFRVGDGVQKHWLQIKYPNRWNRFVASALPKRRRTMQTEKVIFSPSGTSALITNSELVKKHILKYYPYSPENIYVVHNGVDSKNFYPLSPEEKNTTQQQMGLNPQQCQLLFIAHNWERKGLKTILLGAQELFRQNKVYLTIIGRGKPKKWLPLLQSLGIKEQVNFVEPTKNILPFYQTADIFVLPTQYDPFANVCLEAMACGLPVVTSPSNGAHEVIQNGKNGYTLSSAADVEGLKKFLTNFEQSSQRQEMSQYARQVAQEHPLEKNALETIKVLEKVWQQKNSLE